MGDGQAQPPPTPKPRETVIQPERLPIKDDDLPDAASSTTFACPEGIDQMNGVKGVCWCGATMHAASANIGMIMEPNIKDGIVYFPNAVCEIPECSLFSFVKNNVEGFRVKTALIDGSKSLSFLDTLSLSGRFAEGFRLHGIRAGDCVLALIPNTADALVATWALTFSGVTVVFPNSQRTDNELQQQVEESGVSYVLTSSAHLNTVRNIDKHHKIKAVILTDRIDGYVSLLDFFVLPCADVEALSPSNTREATAAIGYTSGSTGAPKGVVLTHYSYIASICTFRCG
ncbi:hypothetical protein HPB51_016716 [Rhipicephalus microplus]|uniref:AMP-dependent synthetase/ligase domain-containing protein n=1 Tax=Rhipicephalus microplus TaxID=6941 RepID=A0A9J6DB79_RHIMP|nr:hypothetical protein HPB51_016716 [Rhipicephalus microplus]